MNEKLLKAERLAKTKGFKGWIALFLLLGIMCADQFLLDLPYENVIFPILVICAASMSFGKNLILIAAYSIIFELSCVAWIPTDLVNVKWWLLEVFIGYLMPFVAYRAINRKHRDMSVIGYSAIAALGAFLYYAVSAVATSLIWKVPFVEYYASDLLYQLIGCAATFVCALPVAVVYKFITGELALPSLSKKSAEGIAE